ncbi:hypothetical protein ACP4OV_002291 [Aristida adscensionis]
MEAGGGGDDDGGRRRGKRFQEAGGCTDDGESRRDKRHRVGEGCSGDDGGSGDGAGDCYMDGGSDDGGGSGSGSAGEDFYYDDDSDDEARYEEATRAAVPEPSERRYVVLTEEELRARQEADTAAVAEVLSIPAGFAAALLRHFGWRPGRVQEEWFSDERCVRAAVGLPPDGAAPVATALGARRLVCAICFRRLNAGRTLSAACAAHFYCGECWRGYLHAAVGDGARCLSLRCPDPSCPAAVVRELVDAAAGDDDKALYARFLHRSYVEESGGRLRWCPAPGCTRAVEFAGCADDSPDVLCACGHGFCFRCGEEAHRPVSCATVRAWLLKNVSDGENANWLLANTKHCPKCRRPIEKNQGCNNMTCRAPCGHRFCWICLDALGSHHLGCDAYRPRHDAAAVAGRAAATAEEARRRQAKASLDRYLYHYERWAANRASLEKVGKDVAELEASELEKMAAALDVPSTELGFLTAAYEQIAGCRRVLRWAYAYGYFLDPERDAGKRALFDQLQRDANRSLERLHGCAEQERKELFAPKGGDDGDGAGDDGGGDKFKEYKEKLAHLTGVTRSYFENLVKAFETDLAWPM